MLKFTDGQIEMNVSAFRYGFLHCVRCLLASCRGGTLIEFAFVAPFVILLLTATVEVAVTLFVEAAISGAAESAARDIRTGRVQEDDDPLTAFRTKLCDSLFGIIDCNAVVFDVRAFADFGSVDTSLQLDENGNVVNAQFAPGESGEITIVRVSYRWQFLTPLVGEALASDGTGGVLLLSTMAFQNEPYELGG